MMSYTPDPRQRIERAQRFFARLDTFTLECPACGRVYAITSTRGHPWWDPTTGRFKCTYTECARQYVLGILAWPIIPSPRVASATPEDQVPSPRQLAQLRKEGGGWWMAEEDGQRYARPHTTNLTTEEHRPDDDED